MTERRPAGAALARVPAAGGAGAGGAAPEVESLAIPGGTFRLGADDRHLEEGPVPEGARAVAADGVQTPAPVASRPLKGCGPHDMAGDVRDQVPDRRVPRHAAAPRSGPESPPAVPAGRFPDPSVGPRRVIAGGSGPGSEGVRLRRRPAARQAREPGPGTNRIDFRLAFDPAG